MFNIYIFMAKSTCCCMLIFLNAPDFYHVAIWVYLLQPLSIESSFTHGLLIWQNILMKCLDSMKILDFI